jgi:hypothetical protein
MKFEDLKWKLSSNIILQVLFSCGLTTSC